MLAKLLEGLAGSPYIIDSKIPQGLAMWELGEKLQSQVCSLPQSP